MAGSQGSALAVAVSNAGGLGSQPCAMIGPDQIRKELQAITAATSRPYNVNFFVHKQPTPDPAREDAWRKLLAPYLAEHGIDPETIQAGPQRQPFDDAAADVLEEFKPPVVSFHFGLPSDALMQRVKSWGSTILSSATTVDEARYLEAHGVDAVIAQGYEAGGHRGMFLTDDLNTQVGTFALVQQIVRAVKVPVVAAGGIGDANGVKAAMALGAAGAQVGTAYLFCPEATTNPLHRAALKVVGAQDDCGHESVHRSSGPRHRQSPDARDRSDECGGAGIPPCSNGDLCAALEGRAEGHQRLHVDVGWAERRRLSGDAGGGIDAAARGWRCPSGRVITSASLHDRRAYSTRTVHHRRTTRRRRHGPGLPRSRRATPA